MLRDRLRSLFRRGAATVHRAGVKPQGMSEMLRPAQIQREQVVLRGADGGDYPTFVDAVAREGGRLVIVGWSVAPLMDITVRVAGVDIAGSVVRHERVDVSSALERPAGERLGFSFLSLDQVNSGTLSFALSVSGGESYESGRLLERPHLSPTQRARVPELATALVDRVLSAEMGSSEWWEATRQLGDSPADPETAGSLDNVFVSPAGGGVVFGWVTHPIGSRVWLEDESGRVVPLNEAFRYHRGDLAGVPGIPYTHTPPAFLLFVPWLHESRTVRLRCANQNGICSFSSPESFRRLPQDPRSVAGVLSNSGTGVKEISERVRKVDVHVMPPLIEARQKAIRSIEPTVHVFGSRLESPLVSIIIPLYGRADFIEHQLIEFSRDPGLLASAEIIYVVDDPRINEVALHQMRLGEKQFGVPTLVVLGNVNRGFSGANNLGYAYARGEYLLFMNSDVIPHSPGWLEHLLEPFESSDSVGMVGARLLFYDGSLQHGGMQTVYLDYWGENWSNIHPSKGIPPELISEETTEVVSLNGACIVVKSSVLKEVGLWPDIYLMGDFEDSDLCVSLRSSGYRMIYQPQAQLVHLERQSLSTLGTPDTRLGITVLNSALFERKWTSLLDKGVTPSSKAIHSARVRSA